MKRIVVSVVVLSMLMVLFCFPASAAEGDFTFQVLDYSLPNGGTTRSVNITSGASVYFDLPQSATYYYVDMLIRSDTDLNSVICDANGISLTVQKINDNSASLYRVYGDINGWTLSRISFTFHFTTGSALIFESFRISTLRLVPHVVSTAIAGSIPGNLGEERIDVSDTYSGDSVVFTHNYVDLDSKNDRYYLYFSFDSWQNYDYIDLSLILAVGEINSIVAELAGVSIPFEVNYIDDPDLYYNDFYVNIRLDLTGVDRSALDFPVVSLTGIVAYNDCLWAVTGATGYTVAAEPSPWMYWFGKLGGWISDQTAAIHSWGSSIVNSISTWGQNIFNNISTWGQNIVNVLSPDTSASDEVVNDAVSKGEQLGGLNQQIGSIEKPDVSGSADISGIISPGDLSTSATFLTTVVNAPYISQVVMLALILSLAAYVLFGKR